jgi:hypothetical protein
MARSAAQRREGSHDELHWHQAHPLGKVAWVATPRKEVADWRGGIHWRAAVSR